ncbi:Cbb3-type cytochrome oxidase [Paenibacillus popilliae ATCC 14706]|uniref:Cbb3-type cytochrome oxidase n=2 Tax=Paenibacillus popilliae TaxID=78057 RepID=M9LMF0_PAEPP|nr:Cbb3-type cytochrome oxidase [Paenibacillus popilliae ATCC 14706]
MMKMQPAILHTDTKEIIKSEFPINIRGKILSVVEQAYTLTRESIKHTSILNWELGKLHEGYLRNLAIGYLFQKQIDLKELPLSYSYEYNRNRSHKYLVLSYNQVVMTFSQVKTTYNIARPAYFRDKLQLANQGMLYFPDIDVGNFLHNENYYLLLTYSSGGSTPEFVNIGFPHQWRERINLLHDLHVIHQEKIDDKEPEETITSGTLIDFRNFTKEVEGLGGK